MGAGQTIDVTVTGGSATGGGIDYSNTTLVNIPAGIYDGTPGTALAINLAIVNDTLYESNEAIDLALANPSAGLTIDNVNGDAGIQTTCIYTILDDENSILLRLTKSANKTEAVIGDIVTYQVNISNTITSDIANVTVSDQIPPNFKYIEGSARLNGSVLADPTGNRPLLFNIGTVPALVDSNGNGWADPGEPGYLRLRYQLVVGSGAIPGDYTNTAVALNSVPTSNPDSATVTIKLDPLFDQGTIIDKVYMDTNRDGWQDPDEKGVAGSMVALDDGTYALTDKYGRYHFPALFPGHRLVKINLHTLGAGAVTTTGDTMVVDLTPGLLAKANFGVLYETETERIGSPGQPGIFLESQVLHKPIQVVGGAENLALLINGEMASIPTDDIQLLVENLNEVVEIKGNSLDKHILFQTDPGLGGGEKAWRLNIMDARGKVVRTLHGDGSLPNTIRWDGRLNSQQTVKGGEIYHYQMVVEYTDGSQASIARKLFGINQATAIFLNLTGEAFITDSAELSPKAKEILKETAVVLRKYPEEKVIIEGHTDSLGTDEYNIDLSRRRAESALRYLVNEERLPQDRFAVRWYGESRPIASNEYAETRALNRRIEIKGQVDDIKRSKLYNQYRTQPSVKINGESVKLDSNGRFSLEVADKSVKKFDIEVINVRGQSYKTTIDVPSVEILNREDKILLPYGGHIGGYNIDGSSTAQTPLLTYDLHGKTEPGNSVEIDGASVAVMADGTFQSTLSLKRGNNPFGLLVRNPAGISRIVNLMVTLTVKAEHQQTITGTENDQTTLGVEYQIHPSLALEASGKTATDGQAAWGGAVLTLGDKRFYLRERLVDDNAGRSTATVLGAESPLGASGPVYSEYQWEHTEKEDLNKSVLGARQQWEVTKGVKVDLSGDYSTADSDRADNDHLTISAGLSYTHPSGFKFTTRNEIGRDSGDEELTQFLTSNFAELKLNPDFTALGKFHYSETIDDGTDETEADFTEFSIGLAFRPVDYDRFNTLAKYTLLFQEGPQELGKEEIFRPKTQVASIDFSLDITRWLEWVEKGALKINQEEIADMPDQTTYTYLWINRLNFNVWKDFDLGVEYRMVFQPEADDTRQGFLTELMWEPVDHFRVGVGYNFTDFSDNEFSNNDYSSHGLFMRFQATF